MQMHALHSAKAVLISPARQADQLLWNVLQFRHATAIVVRRASQAGRGEDQGDKGQARGVRGETRAPERSFARSRARDCRCEGSQGAGEPPGSCRQVAPEGCRDRGADGRAGEAQKLSSMFNFLPCLSEKGQTAVRMRISSVILRTSVVLEGEGL